MADLEVTTINVRLKLTREVQAGTFKSVELGATALITPEEAGDWRRAQRDLYADLKGQLGALWTSGHAEPGAIAHRFNGHQRRNGGAK